MEGGSSSKDAISGEQSVEARSIESIIAPAIDRLAVTNKASSDLLVVSSREHYFDTYQTQGAINELATKLLNTLRGI